METMDPVTLEIIANNLGNVCAEMAVVIHKTSRSPICNETRDFSTALLDARGRLIAQTLGCPILMGASKWSAMAMIEDFKDDLHEGDVIISNDSYHGGAHLGDMTLLMPIFYKGELILVPSARAHQADAGGGGDAPGGMNYHATDILEESIRITPLRICEAGKMKSDVLEWVLRNSRYRDWMWGDIAAMTGSCQIARRRLTELIDRFGKNWVLSTIDYLIDYSERRFRAEIEKWPDGTYEGVSYLDSDGLETRDIKFQVTATVKGSDLKIDFTGSSPQAPGPVNSPIANTWSIVFIALSCMIPEDIPKNEGIFRPVELVAPEGSVVNPREGAPTGICTVHPAAEMNEAVSLALSRAIPQKVGDSWSKKGIPYISGINPRNRKPYLNMCWVTANSGQGAAYGVDGWGGLPCAKSGMAYATVEATEVQFPQFVLEREFVIDTDGPGKWRGGNSIKSVVKNEAPGSYLCATIWGGIHPTEGLQGGKSGSPSHLHVKRKDQPEIVFAGGDRCEEYLDYGDLFINFKGGGGGWGNPLERDPELVKEDVIDEYISVEGAERSYGVIINPDTMEIDYERTAARRREMSHDTELQ